MIQSVQQSEAANRRLFDRVARWYDTWLLCRIFFEPTYRRVMKLLEVEAKNIFHSGTRVLDIACGTGEIIYRLAKKYERADFIGVDLSSAMLQKAKQKSARLKNVHFKEAASDKLPFPDAFFDLLLCTDAFHHFPYPDQALTEMYRVLKANGKLLLVDPAFNGRLLQWMGSFIRRLEQAHSYYGQQELKELLELHHFELLSKSTHYFNNYCLAKKKEV